MPWLTGQRAADWRKTVWRIAPPRSPPGVSRRQRWSPLPGPGSLPRSSRRRGRRRPARRPGLPGPGLGRAALWRRRAALFFHSVPATRCRCVFLLPGVRLCVLPLRRLPPAGPGPQGPARARAASCSASGNPTPSINPRDIPGIGQYMGYTMYFELGISWDIRRISQTGKSRSGISQINESYPGLTKVTVILH